MIPDQSQASAGCSPGGSTNRQAYWYDRMMFPGGLGSGPGSSSGSSGSISGGFGSSTHSASKAIIRAASSLSISFGSGAPGLSFTAPIDPHRADLRNPSLCQHFVARGQKGLHASAKHHDRFEI